MDIPDCDLFRCNVRGVAFGDFVRHCHSCDNSEARRHHMDLTRTRLPEALRDPISGLVEAWCAKAEHGALLRRDCSIVFGEFMQEAKERAREVGETFYPSLQLSVFKLLVLELAERRQWEGVRISKATSPEPVGPLRPTA